MPTKSMPNGASPSKKRMERKRRLHNKSRKGCGNCKLRRVKCDETRPQCKRCLAYGVTCDYNGQSSELQVAADGAFNIIQATPLTGTVSVSDNQTMIGTINKSFESKDARYGPFFPLDLSHVELLYKFETRTIKAVGTPRANPVYQREVIKLAVQCPFLMHVVLAVTLVHDHFLAVSPSRSHPTTALHHWQRGMTTYNKILSSPIHPSDRDALWATAALLGVVSFAYMDAEVPEEAWPLGPASPMDLNWLRVSEGKKAVWRMVDPFRPDSVFTPLKAEMSDDPTLQWLAEQNFDALPQEFRVLFQLNAKSTSEKNPYHTASIILARLMRIRCTQATCIRFLAIISYMSPEYKRLLETKDPRALLLLSWWFAKLCQSDQWWFLRRARLECQAICIYLERNCTGDVRIQHLLGFPKMIMASIQRSDSASPASEERDYNGPKVVDFHPSIAC